MLSNRGHGEKSSFDVRIRTLDVPIAIIWHYILFHLAHLHFSGIPSMTIERFKLIIYFLLL